MPHPGAKPAPVNDRVILFTRYPEPGRSKTRLIPALGPVGAAELHKELAEKTATTLRQMARVGLTVEIHVTGAPIAMFRTWLGDAFEYRLQSEGDLGRRLSNSFEAAFADGCGKVVAVGADSPDLTVELIQEALRSLDQSDAVIGPAHDGGYYLIGMRVFMPAVFEAIPWGTERVLQATLERLGGRDETRADRSVVTLAVLHDIDRPEDLEHVRGRGDVRVS